MTTITKQPFGVLPDGREVELYRLENSGGAYVNILTYGGTIQSICVPDRDGKLCDVALGFDSIAPYLEFGRIGYMGALIGRHAGRFRNAAFTLNGKTYQLTKNCGAHHLHNGKLGLHNKVWRATVVGEQLVLNTTSCHLEENYPGNLGVQVTYGFDEEGSLSIDYLAVTDTDTVINLTNHCYFNLDGQETGSVSENFVQLHTDRFTTCDADCLTDGGFGTVQGTALDFREYHQIGERVNAPEQQLINADGYDHCYVFTEALKQDFCEIAKAYSEKTGISMRVLTDAPAVQLYSGNFLTADIIGKSGAVYDKRSGFCLEAQRIPNAMEHDSYPHPILRAGEQFSQKTVYRFGNEK